MHFHELEKHILTGVIIMRGGGNGAALVVGEVGEVEGGEGEGEGEPKPALHLPQVIDCNQILN